MTENWHSMSEHDTTAGTWYEATQVAAPERPQLTFDFDVDVCVVGAGLAGLTVAREVARRGWSVAVLEANRVAVGRLRAQHRLRAARLPAGRRAA